MRIVLASLLVNDQDKALEFYTSVLGFVKKHDVVIGESRWVTVVSPEAPDGVELALEPVGFLPSKQHQDSLYEAGTPAMTFASDDLAAEYTRLKACGVVFRDEPEGTAPMTALVFEDSCGNLIRLRQTGHLLI